MTLGHESLDQALASLSGREVSRLTVGFSGGLDSTVLLHWVWQWQRAHPQVDVRAIHINHQLHDEANRWEMHCNKVCQHWGLPLVVERVAVDPAAGSVEQVARSARYHAFERHMSRNEVLLLAHHRDDQVETLLQRLARGSGPLGLAAMKTVSERRGMTIVRPFLAVDRSGIEQYAQQHHLHWINDPSNSNLGIERNYLRHRVLPAWRRQKPDLNPTLARVSRLCDESAQLLAQLGALDAGAPRVDKGLAIDRLQPLDAPRQSNLLRYWIQQCGGVLPSEAVLQAIRSEVVDAAPDACPQVNWGTICARRFQGVLYLVSQELLATKPHSLTMTYDQLSGLLASPIEVGHGCLSAESGQCLTLFSKTALATAPLRLEYRRGGEHVRPLGRHDKRLKDWFQILNVPPWLRSLWPILYCGDRIAGLPGLLVCEGFQAQGPEDAMKIGWHWSASLIEYEQ